MFSRDQAMEPLLLCVFQLFQYECVERLITKRRSIQVKMSEKTLFFEENLISTSWT